MKKKLTLFIFLTLFIINFSAADDDDPNLYMVVANVIFDEFPFPLIGMANISMNNQRLPQIGFVNYNDGNLKSLQLGFTNNVKGDMSGAQIGFSNVALGKVSGVQIGFFNYIDTSANGIPIGFVSWVEKGGYHALELSITEISHINFSFKTGVQKLYSSISVSYDKDAPAYSAFGLGIGSKIPIHNNIFINPELNYMSKMWGGYHQYITGNVLVGYNMARQWCIVLGPDFTLGIADDITKKPVYKIYYNEFSGNKSFIIGGKLGIRFEF